MADKRSENIGLDKPRTYMVFQDGERGATFAGVIPKDQFVQKVLTAIDIEGN